MSFRPNASQQLSLHDSFMNLTEREKKALSKSWAKFFGDYLFPKINEEMFAVLFSAKASRPSTPVNVIVGAIIIKELFDYSDDEIVETLMFDPRMQYALHTTSFEEQPLSDKSLSRFRKRCYDYEDKTGIDLMHDCMVSLADEIAKMMNISGKIRRMDSMMLDANIRNLSRMELIYTCISNLVKYIIETDSDMLPESLLHYADSSDFNKVIYHHKPSSTDDRIQTLLRDAAILYSICNNTDIQSSERYQQFDRCISEQTIIDNDTRRLRNKEDGGMKSDMMQNPSDPEATFRNKAGKNHKGYVGNIEESVGEKGSLITEYQFEQNIHSDSQFLKDSLNKKEVQEEEQVVVTDGAYYSEENAKLARKKNIKLISTDLTGRDTPDIMGDFEFNEDGTKITKCPAGNTPIKCGYDKKTGKCNATFQRDQCANCPNKDKCRAVIRKKVANVVASIKQKNRAVMQRFFTTEEFKNYSRLRNGVETIPSTLRRVFHTDKLPRGKQRGKFFFGAKIGALNFRKLVSYLTGTGNCAPNPIIA